MNRSVALSLAAALVAGTGLFAVAEPAKAQYNPQVYGGYGAEDGYNDDEFGWGPAYRPDTTFRPAYGFYGGIERPYPYGGGYIPAPGAQAPVAAPGYYEAEPGYYPPGRHPRKIVRSRKGHGKVHRQVHRHRSGVSVRRDAKGAPTGYSAPRRVVHRRAVTEQGVWR